MLVIARLSDTWNSHPLMTIGPCLKHDALDGALAEKSESADFEDARAGVDQCYGRWASRLIALPGG